MNYTQTTTLDKNLPESLTENEFDLPGLISLVCELFGVTKSELCSRTREPNKKWARWVIWKFCLENGRMTLKQAAGAFGCSYDHATVIASRKKLPEDLVQFEWLRVIVDKVAAEIGPKTSEI